MGRKVLLIAVILVAAVVVMTTAGDAKGKSKYMVVTTHNADQCLQVMDDVVKQNRKILDKCWMGCMSGEHTGYAMVDARRESDALKMLPPALRTNAKATRVSKLTPKQIKKAHAATEKKMD